MAYGYQYLYGQEEKAIPYAKRWAELDPEDENAPAVIRECKAEIRKRQRSQKKKAKFVPGDHARSSCSRTGNGKSGKN